MVLRWTLLHCLNGCGKLCTMSKAVLCHATAESPIITGHKALGSPEVTTYDSARGARHDSTRTRNPASPSPHYNLHR